MRTEVYELLLANPQVVAGRGRTPIFSGNVGHCAEGTRNGVPGIMVRNGWWYDDLTREWIQLARPPVPSSIGTYTLHTYRGQPTIFGVTECFTNTDVSFLFLIEQKSGRMSLHALNFFAGGHHRMPIWDWGSQGMEYKNFFVLEGRR